MSERLRALTVRGRWKYRGWRWKLRRRRSRLRRALASPLGVTSLALFPFVILMAASAAMLRPEGPRAAEGISIHGPLHPVSARALAPYREHRDDQIRRYALRFDVPLRLAGIIYAAATEERVDPDLAFRLVRTESSFRPRAVGPAGAVGLAQVRPSTARWLDSTITRERLFEAKTNLRLGFRYLRMLLDMYDHDTRLALLAYNRGPGTVAAILSLGEDPGNGYAARVMGTRPVAGPGVPAASVTGDDAPAAG